MIKAEVVQHSISPGGAELVTLVCEYPRFIHGEVMTHRVFSRNAASSRAIPVKKMLDQVRKDPVVPLHWGANQPGMQAHEELTGSRREEAEHEWRRAAEHAAYFAESLNALGLHKQIANRLLEPFQWMKTIITATDWQNFFDLRDHPDAEPHFQRLAKAMKEAIRESHPVARGTDPMDENSWHLPFVSREERDAAGALAGGPVALARMSAARCARVSYLNHDGTLPSPEKDLELYHKLAGAHPVHASPLEHAAVPSTHPSVRFANFKGWLSLRWAMEQSPIVQRIGEDSHD